MGPRVAFAGQVDCAVYDNIMSYVEPEHQVPFNTARAGLDRRLDIFLQRLIGMYAERPVPQLDALTVYHPQPDYEAMREFGEWCVQGCPVTVDGLVYRYRYGLLGTSSSSSSSAQQRTIWHV